MMLMTATVAAAVVPRRPSTINGHWISAITSVHMLDGWLVDSAHIAYVHAHILYAWAPRYRRHVQCNHGCSISRYHGHGTIFIL